jgi:GNAT superfamily N-acetyltransferase
VAPAASARPAFEDKTVPGTLTFRQDYFGDPVAFRGLVALLQDIFGIDIGLQNRLGGPDPSSMPFGYFDGPDRCVANFSAFSMPLVIGGRTVKAAGYQSGAVRPDFRGQGLYRDLMRRAFSWADAAGFEAGILLTDKPDLYAPYGFHVVPQFQFCGKVPTSDIARTDARELDLTRPEDLALVQRILCGRQPVSNLFAVARQSEMFLLNACFDPGIRLSFLPALNAVIAWKMTDDNTLQLLDIGARHIPPLVEITAALGLPAEGIAILFPPDRLNWKGEPQIYEGSCALMIKGFEPSTFPQPAMLSPMADF